MVLRYLGGKCSYVMMKPVMFPGTECLDYELQNRLFTLIPPLLWEGNLKGLGVSDGSFHNQIRFLSKSFSLMDGLHYREQNALCVYQMFSSVSCLKHEAFSFHFMMRTHLNSCEKNSWILWCSLRLDTLKLLTIQLVQSVSPENKSLTVYHFRSCWLQVFLLQGKPLFSIVTCLSLWEYCFAMWSQMSHGPKKRCCFSAHSVWFFFFCFEDENDHSELFTYQTTTIHSTGVVLCFSLLRWYYVHLLILLLEPM